MSNTDFTTAPDYFDSRDAIARLEELRNLKTEWWEANGAMADEYTPETMPDEWTEDDEAELTNLEALEREASGCCADWKYGETLIHEARFTDYVKELLIDCGCIPADMPSFIEIDWEATANNIKADYVEYGFNGVTYYAR